MLLLAIDLYGIKPFQKPTRITLKPGLNLVAGPNGSGKTAVFRVLSSLLLNAPVKGISFIENQPAQTAVIFLSRDGGTYRIAVDFLKGIFNLSKLDPSGKGVLIEKERDKIMARIRQEVSGVGEDDLTALFMIDRSRLPSTYSLQNIREDGPAPSVSISPAAAPSAPASPPSGLSPQARAEKEKELEEAKKKVEELTQYEDEMLRLKDKASEIKHRIDQHHDLELQWNQLQGTETKRFSILMGVDIDKVSPDLLRRYEAGVEARQNERLQVEEEKGAIDAELARIGGIDPLQDRPIQIGIGIAVITFLLPLFITLRGLFRYIFLLGVLGGIGWAGFSYFKLTQRTSVRKALEKKWAGLNDKIHQLDRKFEKDFKEVLDLMKKTGLKDLHEFQGLQRNYQNHLQNKKEIQAEKEAVLKGDTLEALQRQCQDWEEKTRAMEEGFGGYERLTQEVYRLQEELRSPSGDESPNQGGAVDLVEMPPFGAPAVAAESLPPASSFVSIAFSIGKRKKAPLPLDEIQKQAAALYALFTPAKKEEISLDETGEIKIGGAGLDRLSSGNADQLYLSVALSILDRFTEVTFPLILDDPWVHFDPKRQEIALELLRGAAKNRQIVLFTVHPSQPNNADNRVQLIPS